MKNGSSHHCNGNVLPTSDVGSTSNTSLSQFWNWWQLIFAMKMLPMIYTLSITHILHNLCDRVDTDKTCLGAAGGQNIGKMWNKICEIGTKQEIGSWVGFISFQQIFSLQDDPMPLSISDPRKKELGIFQSSIAPFDLSKDWFECCWGLLSWFWQISVIPATKSMIRHMHWPIFVILMIPSRKYPSISPTSNWGQTR